jgi:hypothetical protein
MFQAVPPPIIRSSKLYKQRQVFVGLFLLLTAMVGGLEEKNFFFLRKKEAINNMYLFFEKFEKNRTN